MDDKPQDISQPTEAPAQTVSQAAETLGVDSFTVLTFIQEGRLNPGRTSSGEITISQAELSKLLPNPQTVC
jgi:predicted site-specific integrase-resolvase